jgi:hypothetical protein
VEGEAGPGVTRRGPLVLATALGRHACGEGLDEATPSCFGGSAGQLSLEELAALVAHEHRYDTRKHDGFD